MTEHNKKEPFSVLMSLYINEKAAYFDKCMKSILCQTVMPAEIVIVKDGPVKKDVENVLRKYVRMTPGLIRVVSYKEHRGLGYALACGIRACRYDLVARMDTDDIARRDRFEKQLAQFAADPELDLCGSSILEFRTSPSRPSAVRCVPVDEEGIRRYQKRRDAFNHMTVMYKKPAVLKAGNYQVCPLMEDTFLWVRMILSGAKCKNIDQPLVYARAGAEMYRRRGGFSYFLKYQKGRRKVLETGFISRWDYMITLAVQLFVALVPGKLREWMYVNLLR